MGVVCRAPRAPHSSPHGRDLPAAHAKIRCGPWANPLARAWHLWAPALRMKTSTRGGQPWALRLSGVGARDCREKRHQRVASAPSLSNSRSCAWKPSLGLTHGLHARGPPLSILPLVGVKVLGQGQIWVRAHQAHSAMIGAATYLARCRTRHASGYRSCSWLMR